jgi:hypothetical protein
MGDPSTGDMRMTLLWRRVETDLCEGQGQRFECLRCGWSRMAIDSVVTDCVRCSRGARRRRERKSQRRDLGAQAQVSCHA